jgi:hypothetical protein
MGLQEFFDTISFHVIHLSYSFTVDLPSAHFDRKFYVQKHRATTANMDQHNDGVVERL